MSIAIPTLEPALDPTIDFTPDGVRFNPITDLGRDAQQASFTDVDRARLVLNYIRSQGRDVLWCNGRGYFVYEKGVWHADEEGGYLQAASHQVGDAVVKASEAEFAKVAGAADKEETDAISARATQILKCSWAYKRQGQIEGMVRSMRNLHDVRTVESDDLDADNDGLAVSNGVIDLRTGALTYNHAPDLVTQQLTLAYDEEAECPRWQTFLQSVIVDENGETDHDVLDWLQKVIGYGITGHTSEQMFLVLHGIGANGKGVFTETLNHVFAQVARTTSFDTFETRSAESNPPIARLAGARLVFASEGDSARALSSALIKRLSGEDTVLARHLYQRPFEFKPNFLVVLSTNHRPNVRDHSEGYWRRVRMVPFRRFFAEGERDRNLHAALREEAQGILRWAVEGARRWHEEGLKTPAAIEAETVAYRESQDRLAEFLAVAVDVTGDRDHRVKVSSVWKAYKGWADDNHEDHHLRRTTFVTQMRQKNGVGRDRVQNQEVFTGLRLVSDTKQHANGLIDAASEADQWKRGNLNPKSGTFQKNGSIRESSEIGGRNSLFPQSAADGGDLDA